MCVCVCVCFRIFRIWGFWTRFAQHNVVPHEFIFIARRFEAARTKCRVGCDKKLWNSSKISLVFRALVHAQVCSAVSFCRPFCPFDFFLNKEVRRALLCSWLHGFLLEIVDDVKIHMCSWMMLHYGYLGPYVGIQKEKRKKRKTNYKMPTSF